MQEKITHKGIIKEIGRNAVTVEIEQASACGSCHARGLCTMSEKADKEIVIKTKRAGNYNIGQTVNVSLMSGMGLKAVLYAYVLSLVSGAVFFTAASFFTDSQIVWALCGLAGVALYFAVLRLCSPRLNRKFNFVIED